MIKSMARLNELMSAEFGEDYAPPSLRLGSLEELEAFVTPHHPSTDVLKDFGTNYLLAENTVMIDCAVEWQCLEGIKRMHDWIDVDRSFLEAGFLIISKGDTGHFYLDLKEGKVVYQSPEETGMASLQSMSYEPAEDVRSDMLSEGTVLPSLASLDALFLKCMDDVVSELPWEVEEILEEYA